MKLCECGCGGLAPVASYSDPRRGWVKGQPKRFISGHNSKLDGNPNWGGGRIIEARGYVRIVIASGEWAYEHRLVAERKLGRPLTSKEIVHHIDGDRMNNSPENLLVVTQGEHMRIHAPERRRKFCKRGHPFLGENLRLDRNGNQVCRTCNSERCRRWKERQLAAGAM